MNDSRQETVDRGGQSDKSEALQSSDRYKRYAMQALRLGFEIAMRTVMKMGFEYLRQKYGF